MDRYRTLKFTQLTARTSFLRLNCWKKQRKSGGWSPSFPFYLKVSLSRLRIVIFQQTIVSIFHAVRLIKNLVSSRFSWPSHPGTSADAARCKQSQEQNRSFIVAEEYCIRLGFQNIWQSRITNNWKLPRKSKSHMTIKTKLGLTLPEPIAVFAAWSDQECCYSFMEW